MINDVMCHDYTGRDVMFHDYTGSDVTQSDVTAVFHTKSYLMNPNDLSRAWNIKQWNVDNSNFCLSFEIFINSNALYTIYELSSIEFWIIRTVYRFEV
jgi:hypothetical protein